MLTSARAAFADKPNTPRGCESLEEMGVASMEDRMQRTMDLYKSNPNTFRLKPIRKPELPEAARASSPRWHTRSAFNMSESNFVGAIAPSPPKSSRPAAVRGPVSYTHLTLPTKA